MPLKTLIKELLRKRGYEIRPLEAVAPNLALTAWGALLWMKEAGLDIRTILDVGGSNGTWSRPLLALYPSAGCVLFEPQAVHFEQQDVFARDHPGRVTLVRKAVGSEEGRTYFHVGDSLGGALLASPGPDAAEFPMTSIDASVKELAPEAPYLLKLDTHGCEGDILHGAVATLPLCSALVIEAYAHRFRHDMMLFWELCERLAGLGFRPVRIFDAEHRKLDGALWQFDILFVPSTWPGWKVASFD